jgi:hypothetical protein
MAPSSVSFEYLLQGRRGIEDGLRESPDNTNSEDSIRISGPGRCRRYLKRFYDNFQLYDGNGSGFMQIDLPLKVEEVSVEN